ncbi:MAG: excinuclease ABC subunit C [Acidobacteria bacterium 13_1_40CM_56_16]|nr:MAG: excinuclease ABC subunit C [Acidobacteria bacterium 13_1_40CM_56_16]
MNAVLEAKLNRIPAGPGVYLYKDRANQTVYVGKAKSLRNRVRTYFQLSRDLDQRKDQMMDAIEDVEFIMTDTEGEALALENNLIKQYKPKYNVLLRDDKTYPYIKLTVNEPFPRAVITRRVRKDGALYFGPFFPAGLARKSLKLIERYFLIRNCNIQIDGKRPRPCLQYYIHRCVGPCVEGNTTYEQYQEAMKDVRLFLEGRNNDLIKRLRAKMEEASANQEFELAAHYRDAVDTMEALAERQKMAVLGYDDIDIFGYHQEENMVSVSIFHMRGGRVVDKKELFWEDQENFDAGEFFQSVLKQYYVDAPFIAIEIHVPVDFEDRVLLEEWLSQRRGRKVEIRTPQRGAKREMMDLVNRNARLSFLQRFRAAMPSPAMISKDVEEVLDLEKPPRRIECFDISNLQGSDVVASMVVWEDGRMKKSDYRRFIIRSLSGLPDDFQSMREVVTRRYKRIQDEGLSMPDLVLIDGGVGQLHAAQSALDGLNIVDQSLASIAKKEEIIYIAGREDEPVILERRSPVLRLIQQIRDESHRFAITFHRQRRGRRILTSELCDVEGIGLKTTQKLLTHFGSVAKIKEATVEDLQSVVNRPQAEAVWKHFH